MATNRADSEQPRTTGMRPTTPQLGTTAGTKEAIQMILPTVLDPVAPPEALDPTDGPTKVATGHHPGLPTVPLDHPAVLPDHLGLRPMAAILQPGPAHVTRTRHETRPNFTLETLRPPHCRKAPMPLGSHCNT